MANVSLSCTCGAVKGTARDVDAHWRQRVVCMCSDCQTFARFLKRGDDILDANGGTDIFQLAPAQMHIEEGRDHIACMRLSPKGLLRWYTTCCSTPVGNTPAAQIPFVGVPHLFMDHQADASTRDDAVGPVSARIHADSGYGAIPSGTHRSMPASLVLNTVIALVVGRLRGRHMPSPFFDPATGAPVSEPHVLAKSERVKLRSR